MDSRSRVVQRLELLVWTADIFSCAGLSRPDSEIVATNLIDAECRGVRSHGLLLVPTYIDRILAGGIRTSYQICIAHDFGALLFVDGGGGPGQVIGHSAMRLAIDRATKSGISCAVTRNSNHAGMLATYGLLAAEAGMVGIALTNSGPSVAAFGGIGRSIGNNALCISAPARPRHFVFDAAMGAVACGKIRYAALVGEPVPNGWLQTMLGESTSDPNALDAGGAVQPLGGYKGFGLAVSIDILTALLGGSPTSPSVRTQRENLDKPTESTQTFIAIQPQDGAAILPRRIEEMLGALRATASTSNVPVSAPGDKEWAFWDDALTHGVVVHEKVIAKLDRSAAKVGARQFDTCSSQPITSER